MLSDNQIVLRLLVAAGVPAELEIDNAAILPDLVRFLHERMNAA